MSDPATLTSAASPSLDEGPVTEPFGHPSDTFDVEPPRAVEPPTDDELTDRQRAQIERDNEEAQRRRSEAYAAMAPATGEYERPPAPKQSAMVLLENVTKIYPGNVVGLKDVSLQIDKG